MATLLDPLGGRTTYVVGLGALKKAIAYQHSLPTDNPLALQHIELTDPMPGARHLQVEAQAVAVTPVDTLLRQRAAARADVHLGPINAANLRRAHALLDSSRARSKRVLEGF